MARPIRSINPPRRRPTRTSRPRRAPAKKVYKPRKGLGQVIVPMTRTITSYIDTDQTSNLPQNFAMSDGAVTGYHALLGTQIFQASQLPEIAELANVFQFYKINAVRVTLTPCFVSNVPNGATTISNSATYQGQNIHCTYTKNLTGVGLSSTIDQDYFNTRMARKMKIITGNRPITFMVYPKILNEVYASLTNSDYTLMKPKFIATTELSTPHYGLDMAFQFVGNDPIRTNFSPNFSTPIKFRMDIKYYLQLKGTK